MSWKLFLIFSVLRFLETYVSGQQFEDITARKGIINEASSSDRSSQRTRIEQSKQIMSDFLKRRNRPDISNERMESLRFLPDPNERTFRTSGSGAYGLHNESKSKSSFSSTAISRDSEDDRQVVAGIPDMSDPCFRRYANCIVVNAQPYERRSATSLIKCKSHCLHSQTGVYSCRSFVYDNINQVCDLFAHVGDQSPARLLKFQTRDYFEPTSAIQCLDINETPDVDVAAHASHTDERKLEQDKVKVKEQLVTQKSPKDEIFGQQCSIGKKVGFLRTEGFELYSNDDITLTVTDISECSAACEANKIKDERLDCRSFDFFENQCSFTKEAAVPVGEGQLKQKTNGFYYEKICVSEKFTSHCSSEFARFPQMILVGFAENVADSSSFEHCFDSCLNSVELYGFNCTSGMYYFEETTLNCILNSENRQSYPELFTEENTDIVDYFEVGCGRSTRVSGITTLDENRSEKLVLADETETEWTDCEDGIQHRRRDCNKGKNNCGLESRACSFVERSGETAMVVTTVTTTTTPRPTIVKSSIDSGNLPTRDEIQALKKRLLTKGFSCPENHCCNVFNRCNVGLRHNIQTKQLEYCKDPCKNPRKRQI